jgi:hypothetical protein
VECWVWGVISGMVGMCCRLKGVGCDLWNVGCGV